jgi:hypothetical protein
MSFALPVFLAGRSWLRAMMRGWPALLPALVFLPVLLLPPVNHDVAAVLSFAERWLAGELLYVDLIDVNPPLVFVLNLLPAGLARVTGLGGVAALQLCLVVLCLGVWRLALAVRDRAAEGRVERAVLDVLPGLVAFGAGYDFGQRETLMAAMALPYLLAAARRMQGEVPRRVVLAAVVARVGFALKPHFLVVPALVELAVLVARRRALGAALRDPAPWAMAAVWAVYLASLPVLFPDYLGAVVPLVLDYYLANGGQTPLSLLVIPRMGTAVAFLLPLAAMAFLWGGALARVLALAGLGAVASALAQHKGWSYHIMPIELFACALAVVLAARWLDGLGPRFPVRVAAGLGWLFVLFLVAAGEAPWNQLGWRHSDAHALTRMLREHAGGERVLVLSPGIAPIYPALNYARARMTLRTMNIWLLEGAYQDCPADGRRYRETWEMGRPEFFVYRTVAEDFARAPPAAVVLDEMAAIPECGGEAFSLEAYFSRHPLFAEVWSHYVEVGRHGRYRVYARRG